MSLDRGGAELTEALFDLGFAQVSGSMEAGERREDLDVEVWKRDGPQ
jgi:hypothetical protein